MPDCFTSVLRHSLPPEIAESIEEALKNLETCNFRAIFQDHLSQILLGKENPTDHAQLGPLTDSEKASWSDCIARRLDDLLNNAETAAYRRHHFLVVGYAALQAFLQSNVTGPPLGFSVDELLWPAECHISTVKHTRTQLIQSLSVDGISAHRLIPNVELFALANTVLNSPSLLKYVKISSWARARVLFVHQRLLSEPSLTLQTSIDESILAANALIVETKLPADIPSSMLIERAAIDIYYGEYKSARRHLADASRQRGFKFALTGRLGKRTKYQEKDTSQLVVLACSASHKTDPKCNTTSGHADSENSANGISSDSSSTPDPANLKLNDDTLLENIQFANEQDTVNVKEVTDIAESLKTLDANAQPLLEPLDSTILLQLCSSITNTSPADGLTREETLPYAQRVLDGGSSNWQVYTQALLIRSRIEGYRPRTVERGLLQLQALVDQVIAETTETSLVQHASNGKAETPNQPNTTFLPRPKQSESAPASTRLQYVHLLTSPTRWELESELAARWTSLGGLRSALEIYERLEMWAEVALCWAATDREDKAKQTIRRELNNPTTGSNTIVDNNNETWEGPPRDPTPADAPRLYCILGDIDNDVAMYEKAWEVSRYRYARAQRSLGRLYFSAKDHIRAADAYTKALEVNQVNGSSWFALGCSLLELGEFERAVEAFARAVQIDDTDAEAWSNLAASLLKRGSLPAGTQAPKHGENDDDTLDESHNAPVTDPQKHKRDALRAFKRASSLKYDSPRIWDNVLTVAAALSPPSYPDIITAQTRIIELRGSIEGESCIDEDIIDGLVRHVVSTYPKPSTSHSYSKTESQSSPPHSPPNRPGSIPSLCTTLFTTHVIPLITRSSRLWHSAALLYIWQTRPSSALDAHEKAWRAISTGPNTTTTPDLEEEEKQWRTLVSATLELAEAYETFGPMERTEGLGAGSGQVVAKDWRFKARSAIRGVLGRGKGRWEDSKGWMELEEALEGLKGSG